MLKNINLRKKNVYKKDRAKMPSLSSGQPKLNFATAAASDWYETVWLIGVQLFNEHSLGWTQEPQWEHQIGQLDEYSALKFLFLVVVSTTGLIWYDWDHHRHITNIANLGKWLHHCVCSFAPADTTRPPLPFRWLRWLTIIRMIMFGDFSRPKDTRASKSPGLNKDLVS